VISRENINLTSNVILIIRLLSILITKLPAYFHTTVKHTTMLL
jgi:hypothetical protein